MNKEINLDKDMDFEKAVEELEKIVRALETGNVKLDDSLKLYESGIKYVNYCSKLLDDAEAKVKILARNDNNEVVEKDFTVE